ncbi:DUF2846 domain-containing protein [uncultured Desulfobacter sp.]|uniref:DUF2846 domain-containing protein n=1 Tax=uncultured Desulfobacter sp. TaxID=240139 RepID=UPI002AAB5783|nr:DUF2846 domain-containing protein [uncultured Desulfobacter sp.]
MFNENRSIKKGSYMVLIVLLLMVASCGFKHPDMASNDLDQLAKNFETSPSKAKLYIVRPSKFGGAGVEIFPTVNQYASGTLASGSYMLIELDPGEYSVSAAGNLQDPGAIQIDAKAGQLYFIQMYPKVKISVIIALSPGLQIERLDPNDAKEIVMGLKRFNSVVYEDYTTNPPKEDYGDLYFMRPRTFHGAASNNKVCPTVDSRVVGCIEMSRCIRSSAVPGAHIFSAIGKFEGQRNLELVIEKNKDYFITVTPTMGWAYPKLKLELVDPAKNKELVTDCMNK